VNFNDVKAIQLGCKYSFGRCDVVVADFTKGTIGESFSFSGSQREKQQATWIKFSGIGRVVHLPQNLFLEFQKLSGLSVRSSEIPLVKTNLFPSQFDRIQQLHLISDGIKTIEEQAFARLINLIEIYLERNEIKSLTSKLFENNRQLKVINLSENQIKQIESEVFKNLNQLEFVGLYGNECFDQDIGCYGACKINHLELDHILQSCYDNYKSRSDFLDKGEFENKIVRNGKMVKKITIVYDKKIYC
jgi:hypothetical protein